MMRPTSPDPLPDRSDLATPPKSTDPFVAIAVIEYSALLYLGLFQPILLMLVLLSLGSAYLLCLWLRFHLADAERARHWAAVAAALYPWATYLLGLSATYLGGGDAGGAGEFGLILCYGIPALVLPIRDRRS